MILIWKRDLRPLVLFRNNEENQPPSGLYPYLSSWKTNIKNIDSCQIFIVLEEAIVLSNPEYIKNTRHSKSHEPRDIIYVLLGDNTGQIVLIEDDERLGKLNKLKKGDRVRVIGAEGNKVFYDIDDIDGILKSREIYLYVKKYTWVENFKNKTETTTPAAVQ